MKTINIFNRSVLLLLFVGIVAFAFAQDTPPKVIERTLKASPDVDLSVQSKMAEVRIETWDKNEVYVEVRLDAQGNAKADLQKLYDKFDLNIEEGMGKITIIAGLQGHKSMSTTNDKTKITFNDGTKISGIRHLEIDLSLKIPKTASLSIDHKFGDLFLSDISGKVSVDYKHGEFTARNLSGNSYMELGHVDADIASLNKAFVEAKHSDLEISEVGYLNLDASYCDINIEDADTVISSQKHNDLSIEKVGYIKMDEKYSDIEIDHLLEIGDFDLDFSDLELTLDKAFKKLDIAGELSDFEIDLGDFSDFELNMETDLSEIELPDNITIKEDKKDGSHRIIVGSKGKKSNSKIIIITKHGEVIIK